MMDRSVGFRDIEPDTVNSMKTYSSPKGIEAYRTSTIFVELLT